MMRLLLQEIKKIIKIPSFKFVILILFLVNSYQALQLRSDTFDNGLKEQKPVYHILKGDLTDKKIQLIQGNISELGKNILMMSYGLMIMRLIIVIPTLLGMI